jgi:hypothetical protein
MPEISPKQNYQNPVFIVGMPRSGTTLIQGILCNTGNYFAMPETHFFSRVVYGLPDNLEDADRRKIFLALFEKSRIDVDKKTILKLNSQKEIFEYVIESFNTQNQKTFLEKTPRHVFFYSKILKYYPSAKFICMIREPKNVVSSQLTNTRIEKKSIIRLSFLYNKIAAALLNIRSNSNVFIIKYEDLTKEPESILKQTFNFLDIPFTAKFVDSVSAPPEIVASHEFWKNKNIRQETIRKNNADKWQNALSTAEANIVNFFTRSRAEKFGYALTFDRMAVGLGIFQDIRKLLAFRELKRFFSKVHG